MQPVIPTLASTRTRRANFGKKPGDWWTIPHPIPAPPDPIQPPLPPDVNLDLDDDPAPDIEFAGVAIGDEPQTIHEALQRPDSDQWLDAATTEMAHHQRHGTWTIVKKPVNCNLVDGRWVFVVKRNADGSIEKYKARWVAKGFKQRYGIDYEEVFAPTYRLATIRLVCALAALYGLILYSIDITAAFC